MDRPLNRGVSFPVPDYLRRKIAPDNRHPWMRSNRNNRFLISPPADLSSGCLPPASPLNRKRALPPRPLSTLSFSGRLSESVSQDVDEILCRIYRCILCCGLLSSYPGLRIPLPGYRNSQSHNLPF